MKRKFKRSHRHAGQDLTGKTVRNQGVVVDRVIRRGCEIYPNDGVAAHELPDTFVRMVLDDGRKWFEFGFAADQLMQGDGDIGFSDEGGLIFAFAQFSEDLVAWSSAGFGASPTPPTLRDDGQWEHWFRAKLPANASPKVGLLSVFSTDANGDPRNMPFTGVRIGDVDLDLPNFPYTMPADAAQLQADIRAAGFSGATVEAESDVVWQINVPDVEVFDFQDNSRVSWPAYTVPNPVFEIDITVDGRSFRGTFVDVDGNRVLERAFGRLGILPGTRYGTPQAPAPTKNPTFVDLPPLLPPPLPGVPSQPTGPAVPFIGGGQDLRVAGTHEPGATLTRPEIVWTSPGGSEVVAVGTWWKNGVPTDAHGETYSDTADGDLIQYIETATNAEGESTQQINWPRFPVSSGVAIHQAEAHAEMAPLADGRAGAPNMNVFSAFNHTAQTYERNVALWAASLVTQLAACAVWKSHARESYGGVLITPRHVLYCNHAHPHAEGTWIHPKGPETVRFVKADGTVINAIQICQSDYNSARPGYIDPLGYVPNRLDLCVATLDRDMTEHGIDPVPIPLVRSSEEWLAMMAGGVPRLAVSQGVGRPTNNIPPQPISDYPQYHAAMVYIRTPGSNSQAADEPYDELDYRVWDGDSGTPAFLLHRGQIYLEGILVSTPWGRVPAPLHWARINELLAASDAGAVALGRLTAPTGLTVTPQALPID